MTHGELEEHAGYLGDQRRNEAFEAALRAVVRPGDVVLDLGAGTGLLGAMALEAGADRIHAVDGGPILGLAMEAARRDGRADRVIPTRGHSTEIDLPELVDLVIADQLGGFAHDAGVLQWFADARQRLARPDARFVPSHVRLMAAPVQHAGIRQRVDPWRQSRYGMDLSVFAEAAAHTPLRFSHPRGEDTFVDLAEPAELCRIESSDDSPIRSSVRYTVSRPGRLDGLLGWFVAELAPGIEITNDPHDPDAFNRWHNGYALDPPVEVAEGAVIDVGLDLRPITGLLNWSVTIEHDGKSVRRRHAGFLGSFESASDLRSSAQDRPAEGLRPLGTVVEELIDLAEGRPLDDSSRELVERFPERFRSAAHARRVLLRLEELGRGLGA